METQGFLKLHFKEADLQRAADKTFSSYECNGRIFVRLAHDFKHFLRGAVFWDGGMVFGYPRIRRVLHLERGINRYLKGKFYVEEKVDGYNVRVRLVDGTPHAFTRGGFICPFTEDRLSDLINQDFFLRYPDYTLCGEVVGPGSPYNTEPIPYIKEDVVFFCFDVMDNKAGFIPPEQKYEMLERENINVVRRWGPFEARNIPEIRDLILALDSDGREGITLKPEVTKQDMPGTWGILKYVTPSSCLRDIEATASMMAELPAGFYIERIMRAVFFSGEFNMPLSDDYLMRSAAAIYRDNERLIKEIDEGGHVREFFEIKVKAKNTIEILVEHLRRAGVRVQAVSIEQDRGYYKARFYRIFTKGTRMLKQRLKGIGFFD